MYIGTSTSPIAPVKWIPRKVTYLPHKSQPTVVRSSLPWKCPVTMTTIGGRIIPMGFPRILSGSTFT